MNMKMPVKMLLMAAYAWAGGAAATNADTVYDNTTTPNGNSQGPLVGSTQLGDQILLPSGDWIITNLALAIEAPLASSYTLTVRLYANDPVEDDEFFTTTVFSGPSTDFVREISVPVSTTETVSGSFTWTIESLNFNLLRYGPPTTCASDPFTLNCNDPTFFWALANSVFTKQTGTNNNFYARVEADPLDSDGDGMLDSTELEQQVINGSNCPDPLNPDSDGDTLLDGEEVALGTNPCVTDTDEDGLPDNLDPFPTNPEGNSGFLEGEIRELQNQLSYDQLEASADLGENANANQGRRNALCNRLNAAANAVRQENYLAAADILQGVLERMDGEEPPADWLVATNPDVIELATRISEIINLLNLLG
ncbi:MAG: hypothetical protein ACYTHJ_12330 [Planctomycetota bacterium]